MSSPDIKGNIPPPPLLKKKKRGLNMSPLNSVGGGISLSLRNSGTPNLPKASKRKRTEEEAVLIQVKTKKKKRENGGETTKSIRKKKKEEDREISVATLHKMQYGATRQQRHWVLSKFIEAAQGKGQNDLLSDTTIRDYMIKVERGLYDAWIGFPMDSAYTVYRGELYRRHSFELLYAFRSNAFDIMKMYDAEILPSVPPHILVQCTSYGTVYINWKNKQEEDKRREQKMREAKRAETGEGLYRCFKCGGKLKITGELQMRSADEPMTIFMECQRCGFIKRK